MNVRQWLGMSVVVAGLLFPLPVRGQFISTLGGSLGDTATISVSGFGQVIVAPERAVLFVQIETEDSAAGSAALANGAVRSTVTERLASLGFGAGQVTMWGYGAGPALNRGRLPPSGPPGSDVAFEAKSGIRVVIEPVGRLDEVISAVLLAGASSVLMVQFEGGEAEAARREAAQIAVARARVAAESIAKAAGGRLGDLVNVTVGPDYNDLVSTSRFFQTGFMAQGVQVYPSDVSIKVQVQASWVFERR